MTNPNSTIANPYARTTWPDVAITPPPITRLMTSKALISGAIVLALLQGCGGGGGGGGSSSPSGGSTPPSSAPTPTAPAAPAASINFAMKQLQFSWNAVSGATSYKMLESTDGGSTYTQLGGDLTTTSYNKDIAVHLQNWSAARYQVQACNSIGCSTSNTLNASSGVLQTIGYFKASNTGSGDAYGWTLSLSGDGSTLAVGAPYEDSNASGINGSQSDNSATDSGAVYVFTHTNSGWTQQAYIKAGNTLAGANFGEALTLSNDGGTLAVGAPFEDSATTTINSTPNHLAAGAGAAYVFARSGSNWSQQAYIKASNTVADMYFGWSVALSDDGNTLAAGAPGEANSATGVNPATMSRTTANAGAAYLFSRSGSSWSQQAYVKASNTNAEDNFGVALALSGAGTTLAVGAPYESSTATGIGGNQTDNSAAKSGAVYVFAGSGSSWTQQAYVKASNTGAADNFGAALAISDTGDTLAVGAPYESSNATGIGGSQTSNTAPKAGAAYVFKRTSTTWAQQAYIKASNANTNDDFGSALALSSDGNALVVGAIGESANSTGINSNQSDNSKDGVGAAYLFNRSGSTWTQQSYIKPSAATLGNEFGTSIGLSADATTLAISGAFEQSNATGIGGDQTSTTSTDAGALWLY